MKNILLLIMLVISAMGRGQSNIPVSSLPRATTPLDTGDFVPLVQSGHYKRASVSQMVHNTWGLTGNAGSNPSTNFIGTTDNQPIPFRTNNALCGGFWQNGSFFNFGAGGMLLANGNLASLGLADSIGLLGNPNSDFIRVNAKVNSPYIQLETTIAGSIILDPQVVINGRLKYNNGTQQTGYLLSSDADGNATWQQGPQSGAYLPIVTDSLAIGGITLDSANYLQVGNVVTVSGVCYTSTTLTAGDVVSISLPVATTFTKPNLCGGTIISTSRAGYPIYGNAHGNKASFPIAASGFTAGMLAFQFTYQIR